jgi:hypothetical protein
VVEVGVIESTGNEVVIDWAVAMVTVSVVRFDFKNVFIYLFILMFIACLLM